MQLEVVVKKSQYKKCARCWNRRKEVGENKYFPDLCERCWNVVADIELESTEKAMPECKKCGEKHWTFQKCKDAE